MNIKDFLLKKVAEQGLTFLIMGVAIYFLWGRQVESEKAQKADIEQLRKENKECQTTYQEMLLDQITKTTTVIEKNTAVLEKISRER